MHSEDPSATLGMTIRECRFPITFGHRPIYTPRRFYILCAAPPFLISHSSFLIRAELSNPIKGQHTTRATPEPANKKRTPFEVRFFHTVPFISHLYA